MITTTLGKSSFKKITKTRKARISVSRRQYLTGRPYLAML